MEYSPYSTSSIHPAPAGRPGGVCTQGRRGVTLVEVMVALVVLGILVLGGASFMINSRTSILLQGRKRIATELANARLEQIRAIPVVDDLNPQNSITNPVLHDLAWHFIKGPEPLTVGDAVPESITLNGFTYLLQSRVRYLNKYMMQVEAKCGYGFGNQIVDNFSVSNVTRYLPDIQYYQ